MASIRQQYILVGIESDPTRYHGENASRPALLEPAAAEQVLAHIAADLGAMFPAVSRCALSMAGALYDMTQVLRPQLPVYKALEMLQQSANPGSDLQPRLLSIGASAGQMPLQILQPFEDIPLGLLQVLPLLLTGPAEDVDELAARMAHPFAQHSQLPAHSEKSLETHFDISVYCARFMSIGDLKELLRLHLEHFGFLSLWELLDAAISTLDGTLEICAPAGPRFKWQDGAVHSFFESFDWWANYGSGAGRAAGDRQLQSAYVDWTREYRRYQSMLHAHGVEFIQHLPGLEDTAIGDSFLLEESTVSPGSTASTVTEHSADDLGTVAVTVVKGHRQMNFYPLQASGLDDLHRFIRDQGYGGNVAFPGRICYCEDSRQLISENLPR